MRPDGFVLAGGASRRMGADKARLVLPSGRALAAHVGDALAAVCGRVAVVRRAPDAWDLPVVVDPPGPRHPLTGLAAALAAATTPRVIVAPCDLPGLRPEHLAALWAGAGEGTAVAWDGADVQPLLGVFRADEAAAALAAARAGGSVRAFVGDRPRVRLPPAALRNANAPGDLPG